MRRRWVRWGVALVALAMTVAWPLSWWYCPRVVLGKYVAGLNSGHIWVFAERAGVTQGADGFALYLDDPTPEFHWWFQRISTRNGVWVMIPGWSIAAAMWLPAIALWWPPIRTGLRRTRGACPVCGYDRRGIAAGSACPECGTVPAA